MGQKKKKWRAEKSFLDLSKIIQTKPKKYILVLAIEATFWIYFNLKWDVRHVTICKSKNG